jgi:hypothetical protein
MKFFTPELYVQGNSNDDDVVDWVEAEWERRIKRYKRHYKKIEAQLPPMLRRFNDEQCLHDADVFAPAVLPRNAPWNGQEVVIVAQQTNTLVPEYINTLAILQYTITAAPVIETPLESPVFKTGRPHWLYEEVDVVEPGVFSHEILTSDGRVIKLLFSDFTYHIAPLCLPAPAAGATEPKKQQMASA